MLHNRNEQALRETEALYGALCRSVARSILESDADAEECLNDALMTVWNAIPPAAPENYCAYLLKIVRNIALNRCKSRLREKRGGGQAAAALDELTEIFPAKDNVETELEQKELMQAVTAFLRQQPQKHRDLFVCRYWQAASVAELAQQFGMTENHVKVTLSRLRKRLKAALQKEGFL